MGMGCNKKNFPVMPCPPLHTNTTTSTTISEKQDADFMSVEDIWSGILILYLV